MKRMIWSTILVMLIVPQSSAMAFIQFYSEFKKLNITEQTPPEFKKLIRETRCAICHDSTKKKPSGSLNKKFRNPYGEALDELLDKGDKKDKLKIQEALKKVADQKYSGYDKTYGKRIENYQLPYDVPISE